MGKIRTHQEVNISTGKKREGGTKIVSQPCKEKLLEDGGKKQQKSSSRHGGREKIP